jgi:Na+-driven multidrug efflux pump
MLTNMISGLQGIVDHILVGNLVGFTGNAAIGVSFQIFLVVVVFILPCSSA